MFGSRIPLKLLADWCRSVSSSLKAGLSIVETLKASQRRGRPLIRQLSGNILERIELGDDFTAALRSVGDKFPPLLLALVDVAEHTGKLPEVLHQVEGYFRFQLRLRRAFLAQIFWPVFQLVAAILVIALFILIMGILAERSREAAIDFLGLGLMGPGGAVIWLVCSFGSLGSILVVYWLLRHVFRQTRRVDAAMLRIPILGNCLRMLALSRLCLAMRMTLDSGMSILQAMRLSLLATDNGAFAALAPEMTTGLRRGESLHDVMQQHRVFPDEFLEMLYSAEQSGTVPEAMGRLSTHYNEQAEHQLAILNTALGWFVWGLVAAMIVFFIFRIFLTYLGILSEFLPK